MSTPEQPATPALTRKQMRQIRNTGATPIVAPDAGTAAPAAPATPAAPTQPATSAPDAGPEESAPAPSVRAPSTAPVASTPVVPVARPAESPVVPLARPAEPPVLPPPPVADSAVDLGVAPLTRRQARQQERIRTASVPVITPEVAAAYTAAAADVPVVTNTATAPAPAPAAQTPVAEPTARVWPIAVPETQEPKAPHLTAPAPAPEATAPRDEPATHDTDEGVPSWLLSAAGVTQEREVEEVPPAAASASASESAVSQPNVEDEAGRPADLSHAPVTGERGVVSSQLGAGLLAEGAPAVTLPPSFDELITSASTSGSTGTPSALIVAQPEPSGIVAPVAATGEVLVTGTFNLPEGLGSTGAIPGTADGKEVDAVLVDGELPAHSSPTPIAASAAISTVKTPGEIIKPPAPEKGSRLMISLAITAGALALALAGVLILAFVTGVL